MSNWHQSFCQSPAEYWGINVLQRKCLVVPIKSKRRIPTESDECVWNLYFFKSDSTLTLILQPQVRKIPISILFGDTVLMRFILSSLCCLTHLWLTTSWLLGVDHAFSLLLLRIHFKWIHILLNAFHHCSPYLCWPFLQWSSVLFKNETDDEAQGTTLRMKVHIMSTYHHPPLTVYR